MATTDAAGMPYYGTSDPIEPIQNLFNGISTAVSTNLLAETQTIRVANTAGRTAAVQRRANAGRPVSVADPIKIWRADAVEGLQEEFSTDGTNWRTTGFRIDVDGAGGSQTYMKASDVAVLTNANGDATYNFAQPFPSRLFMAVITDATPHTQLGAITLKYMSAFSDRSKLAVRAYGSNGVLPNVGFRFSFVAIGQ